MRKRLIARFNDWVEMIQQRIDIYEESRRQAATVAGWRDELERFKNDPVHNA